MDDPILDARGLTKSFGGVTAVEDLSLQVRRGQITGLIGPNGAGKTTLFNLISGFIRPDRGALYYGPHVISSLRPHAIAKLGIGRGFQDVRLFPRLSVLDNIVAGMPRQRGDNVLRSILMPRYVAADAAAHRTRAMEILAFVNMAGKEHVAAASLSYGQQKRVALARLLAMESDLLLLDEPASGLDPAIVQSMIQLIRDLIPSGKTVVLIEHNLDVVASLCDWLVFLDRGHLLAEGPPADILDRADLVDTYFGRQVATP